MLQKIDLMRKGAMNRAELFDDAERLANALGTVLAMVNRYDDARAGHVMPIADYARDKREAMENAQKLLEGDPVVFK